MDKGLKYERYPAGLVCLSVILALAGYLLGTAIFYMINAYLGAAFLALCAIIVVTLLRYRCSYCYYYGKRCSTGFGLIASKLFKKGDSGEFASPKNLMPAMVLALAFLLLPIIGGVYLVATDGSPVAWALLIADLLLFVPGAFKKRMYCSHCRQRERGCPACDGMKAKSPVVAPEKIVEG